MKNPARLVVGVRADALLGPVLAARWWLRLVRRIPDLNRPANADQASLFELWRLHAFFTASELGTVTAGKTHRAHAIIEQVNADLKSASLAHLPSGKFSANSAWLVCAVL